MRRILPPVSTSEATRATNVLCWRLG